MPIYAYRCEACGHAKDVLQKISDPVLTVCPNCGADAFKKQVTAAGFQLKGSGWYVTDFRGGTNTAAGTPAPAEGGGAPASAPAPAAASPSPSPAAPAAPAPSPPKSDT
jgi:putative FmdB family regulatory protein